MIELDAIMSVDLETIRPDQTLEKARRVMQDRRIHHLPVVDDRDRLVGLLTLSNLLAATDSFLRKEDDRLHPGEIAVAEAMVTDVATVDEKAGIRQAAMFLEKHRIGCLPVVTDGVLKGIITDTDFVGVAINLLEQIEEAEADGEEFDGD